MTFSSSSSSTTANTVSSITGPSRLSLPRGRHDHRDRPTSSQPGSSNSGASRRPISSSATASLSQNSTRRVRRRRRNSGADHSAISQDLLLQLVATLARSYRLPRPSLMCSAVKCRQSAERLPRRRSMSATHRRSGGVRAATGIISTPTVRS